MNFKKPSLFLALLTFLVSTGAYPFANSTEKVIETTPSAGPLIFNPEIKSALENPALRKQIDFWKTIYGKYDSKHGVIHDAKFIDKVYEVVDLRAASGSTERSIRASKARWRNALLEMHRRQRAGLAPETEDQKRVFGLFQESDDPNRFLNAAHRKRLRWQTGQSDYFAAGIAKSGRWLPLMEQEFKAAGLPVELTRLPFVESSFNLKARSKVGASGIWQFMRSTGRNFLTINAWVDERNDPVAATRAAARLLKQNYESLESWPLAVTAYNHGRQGMMRAVRSIGSSLMEDVINQYRSRTFGFASANFFTCLLAAIEIEQDSAHYFGEIAKDEPWKAVEIPLSHSIEMPRLMEHLTLSHAVLKDLNPALDSDVLSGKLRIPAGYSIRLPVDASAPQAEVLQRFQESWEKIPKKWKSDRPKI